MRSARRVSPAKWLTRSPARPRALRGSACPRVHEDEAAVTVDAAVAIVDLVDGGLKLIMAAHRVSRSLPAPPALRQRLHREDGRPTTGVKRRWTRCGAAIFTVQPLPEAQVEPGSSCSPRCAAMISSTPPSTRSTIATARLRSPRLVFVKPRGHALPRSARGRAGDPGQPLRRRDAARERFVVVPYDLPRGRRRATSPRPTSWYRRAPTADKSRTPTSKAIVVSLERS